MTNFLDQLPKRIREIAEQVNVLAPEEILTTPKVRFLDTRQQSLYTLVRKCTPDDVRLLKDAAAKWLAEMPQAADSLFKPLVNVRWSRVSFGCSGLDRCTRGGVVTRGITELCGAAGVGKSQLLLQLSLCVQLPIELGGLGKGVAYICTEDAFPARRLLQMSKACEKRHPQEKLNFLGNIFVEHHYETEPLLNCIKNRLPRLMQQHGIGLIIIDSVAAIFRLYTDFLERARHMRRLADALLSYADKYNCAVVCVNQVASSGGQDEVPCLGLQWAHLGRTRLRVSRVPKQHRMGDQLITVRKLEILYSPETPNDFAEFLITEEGVVDVPEPAFTRPPAKMRRL
ncbi:DNA repair protein XRCC3 [Drosophila ficusphila]|uniref:DNA repair protein XRCC3 n=1 Tax=Drosophila ficusphila TaxID=30025 RepID=UPI0007E710FD|nr:DNA repair protein XRCC3 [Drosophila ficusphila]